MQTALDATTIESILASGDTADAITEDLTLPTGNGKVAIKWDSSNLEVVKTSGEISVPTDGDQVVTLTATITFEQEEQTKEFEVTVLKGAAEVVAKHVGSETIKFSESATDNNAALLGLDPEVFTVLGNVLTHPDYTNPIGLNKDGTIRLYSRGATGLGNTLTISIKEGLEISSLKFDFMENPFDVSRIPTMAELVLGAESIALTKADLTSSNLVYDDLAISSFVLNHNYLGELSPQIWLNSITIAYKQAA